MFFFSHAITVLSSFLLVHAIQGFNTVTGTSKRDTFIISFDGVLASNADDKANMAIEAAILTWPGLLEDDRTYSLLQPDNRCWLTNKMRALSHLNYGQDSYRSLLVRLLVEVNFSVFVFSVSSCISKYYSSRNNYWTINRVPVRQESMPRSSILDQILLLHHHLVMMAIRGP